MAQPTHALVATDLPLTLLAKGKVRDVYDAGITHGPHQGAILFVATDRISAFDIVLQNGIPNKGKLLHALSTFWFGLLTPGLIESHVIATEYAAFPEELRVRLDGPPPSLIISHTHTHVNRIAYQKCICIPVDEIIGADLAKKMSTAAVALYSKAAAHAKSRGIILADTKFEFGVVNNDQMILVDEVLTPDSSRFWSVDKYAVGRGQDSFDKQYVRDWLKANGLDKAADQGVPVTLPDDVVKRTELKYREAYELITGQKYLD